MGPTKVLIGMAVIDMAVMYTLGITMEAIVGIIKLFEQAKEAKEDLRKQHAECKGISLKRRALIDKFLDDEAWNDYEVKKTLDKVDVALSGGFGLAIHGARESEMGEKVKLFLDMEKVMGLGDTQVFLLPRMFSFNFMLNVMGEISSAGHPMWKRPDAFHAITREMGDRGLP
ncbi:hypothetical protein Tco_0969103 [Tanacetum coccineum]